MLVALARNAEDQSKVSYFAYVGGGGVRVCGDEGLASSIHRVRRTAANCMDQGSEKDE